MKAEGGGAVSFEAIGFAAVSGLDLENGNQDLRFGGIVE